MTGKIARLPRHIREQINRRLRDGEPAASIIKWLNALPEVQKIMAAEFDGHPVRAQNLSQWKQRGYRAWLVQQEKHELLGEMVAEGEETKARFGEAVTDKLAGWVIPNFLAEARARLAAAKTPDESWAIYETLCTYLVPLRRGDHASARLQLDRERFDLELKKFADAMAQAQATEKVVDDADLTADEVRQRLKEIYGR
jgi:hypothetical protein